MTKYKKNHRQNKMQLGNDFSQYKADIQKTQGYRSRTHHLEVVYQLAKYEMLI